MKFKSCLFSIASGHFNKQTLIGYNKITYKCTLQIAFLGKTSLFN